MTSNLGSHIIQEKFSESKGTAEAATEVAKTEVLSLLKQTVRPEFINRIDDTVVFEPLDKKMIAAIAKIQIKRLEKRLADLDIGLEITPEAMDKLADAGFDPVFGARPLKRAIQTNLENPLAKKLLDAEFMAGDKIVISVDDDSNIVFTK